MSEARESDARPSPEPRMPLRLVGAHRVPDRRGYASWNLGKKMPRGNGWGPLSDRRSRLAKRAATITRDLKREYLANRPLWRDRLTRAGQFMALAEEMLAMVGRDPAATPPRAAKLQRTADHLLRYLPKRPPRRRTAALADVLAREAKP